MSPAPPVRGATAPLAHGASGGSATVTRPSDCGANGAEAPLTNGANGRSATVMEPSHNGANGGKAPLPNGANGRYGHGHFAKGNPAHTPTGTERR
jgi:hypothetical protein